MFTAQRIKYILASKPIVITFIVHVADDPRGRKDLGFGFRSCRLFFFRFQNAWLLDAFGDVESVTVQKDTISDLGLPYPDCVTLLLRHKGGAQGVLAADVVSRKAVRSFECFGDGIHLFWEGNPKALYEFRDGDKQPVDTYASFEHDSRYSDNIVENAYVDELTNFFAVLKGEEQPRWSFEKDLKAIELMDKIENS